MRPLPTDYMLEFTPERYGGYLDDPSYFLHDTSGRIVLRDDYDMDAGEAGTFRLFFIDADGAAQQGISAFDVYDTSQITYDFYEALFDGHDFSPKLRKLAHPYDYLWSRNLLILDRLEIKPEHRGRSLGLSVMIALMQRFQMGSQIVAIKAFPLQLESLSEGEDLTSLGLDMFTCTAAYASRRLRRYYGDIGFKRLGSTDYMVRMAEAPLPKLGAF
jgi:hypothetical protein